MPARAAITGVAETDIGRVEGSTVMSLHSQAARDAIADAGLEPEDIDGVLCGYSTVEPHMMLSSVFCEYFGLKPTFTTAISAGGATACIMLATAAALVEANKCRHVLMVMGDNRLTGLSRSGTVAALAGVGHPQFEQPYGMTIPAAYALVAQAYLHEYGIGRDELSALAVTGRKHAGLHPKAQMREPITLEDVADSRVIASPLNLLDCCLISDGGAAVVVSSSAAARDLPNVQVEVLGTGQGHTHEHIFGAPSLTSFGCADSSRIAFGEAGVKPADIDVTEIYDSFTITLLVELESIGFFEKGEAGQAALGGALEIGGRVPCNTHGGLLSFGHAGAAGGAFHIIEAVRQLRGQADARQVANAELAFVHGDGGILSAHCSTVLGRV